MGVGNFDYSTSMKGNKNNDGKMEGKVGGGKMGTYAMGKGGKAKGKKGY